MTDSDDKLVSDAIVVWTGWHDPAASWPRRDDERVRERFGADVAAELLPRIKALEDEFYESDARIHIVDLTEMGDVAAEWFRHLHPELTDEAVGALAWCYTFDFK